MPNLNPESISPLQVLEQRGYSPKALNRIAKIPRQHQWDIAIWGVIEDSQDQIAGDESDPAELLDLARVLMDIQQSEHILGNIWLRSQLRNPLEG